MMSSCSVLVDVNMVVPYMDRSEIKEKVVSLPGVEYLYDVMSPKEINIPSFVMEFDRKVIES